MRLPALQGYARLANWLLAAVLLLSVIGGVLGMSETGWLGGVVSTINLLLLAGILLRVPLAYLGVAAFALLGMAVALNNADMLTAVIGGAVLTLALYVRGQIRAGNSQSTGSA
jgi:hypothetical protein